MPLKIVHGKIAHLLGDSTWFPSELQLLNIQKQINFRLPTNLLSNYKQSFFTDAPVKELNLH